MTRSWRCSKDWTLRRTRILHQSLTAQVSKSYGISSMVTGATDHRSVDGRAWVFRLTAAPLQVRRGYFSIHPKQWVGFYRDGEADPTVVTCCSVEFTPSAMPQHHLSLPITKKCYRVGAYSRCFSEWEKPTGHLSGFFHEVKIIHTTMGKEKHKIISFHGRMTSLGWDLDEWWWVEGYYFFN